MLVFDQVLRNVERNVLGVYDNPDYVQTMKSSHIFQLPADTEELINHYGESLFEDFIRDQKMLLPFKNLWLEYSGIQVQMHGSDEVLDKRVGIHLYSFDDRILDSPLYGIHIYNSSIDDREHLPVYSGFFHFMFPEGVHKNRMPAVSVNVGVMEQGMCEEAKSTGTPFYNPNLAPEITDYFNRWIPQRFRLKMNHFKFEKSFCSHKKESCGSMCQEAKAVVTSAISMAVSTIAYINLPMHYILKRTSQKQSNLQKRGKKVRGIHGQDRVHYVLIDHDKLKTKYEQSKEVESDTVYRESLGHERRAHKRVCLGRHGKNGDWIPYKKIKQWVKACWVGSKEFTVGDTIYEVVS